MFSGQGAFGHEGRDCAQRMGLGFRGQVSVSGVI